MVKFWSESGMEEWFADGINPKQFSIGTFYNANGEHEKFYKFINDCMLSKKYPWWTKEVKLYLVCADNAEEQQAKKFPFKNVEVCSFSRWKKMVRTGK